MGDRLLHTVTAAADRDTSTTPALAMWALVAVGTVAAFRVMLWYWPGSFFDGVTSDIWTALAWDFAHGEFYRPLLSPDGYGGTRYMPLLFVVHGFLIRAHVDPIYSGLALMQASVLAAGGALYGGLRAADVPPRLAAPLACTVWCTVLYQRYCTDVRADYLAASLALAAVMMASRACQRPGPSWVALALGACVLAALTKVTAIVVAVPIVIWMVAEGKRALAVRFAVALGVLALAAVGVLQIVSGGLFLENVRATITGGMTFKDVALAIPKVTQEIVSDPFVAAPLVLAVAALASAIRRSGQWSFARVYFVVVLALTVSVFASPGIVANQLVDLHLASTLVVGEALARGDLLPRPVAFTYAVMAILLGVVSIPVPGIPSVIATLESQSPRSRAAARAVHEEFLGPGTRYLSTDPILSVLNDQRAVLLDAFSLERFVNEGTPAGEDIRARVRRHFFDAIVLRDTNDFVRDMAPGDPGFDEARTGYWTHQTGALAQLFRTEYEVSAVRKPFVVLRPR